MGDGPNIHPSRPQRHTAKSDQRFDAGRRIVINTFNADNSRGESTDNIETEKKKQEKDDKNERDTSKNGLYPKDEIKILKHWGLLKKTLHVGNIIDPLIEKGIVTPEKWMEFKRSHKTDQDSVEEFLYLLLNCKHDAYDVFLKVLRSRGYGHLANQLEGMHSGDLSPKVSVSSGKFDFFFNLIHS
jgi:hypothetical protein